MGFNGLDFLLGGLLLVSLLAGLRLGMIKALGGIACFLAALAAAAAGYISLAAWLQGEWGWQTLLAQWLKERLPFSAIPVLNTSSPPYGLEEMSWLILSGISFLLIIGFGMVAGQMLIKALHALLTKTPLAGANHLLGMAVQFLKSLLLLSVLVGIINPIVKAGAQLGFGAANYGNMLISKSALAGWLLQIFSMLPGWIGPYV